RSGRGGHDLVHQVPRALTGGGGGLGSEPGDDRVDVAGAGGGHRCPSARATARPPYVVRSRSAAASSRASRLRARCRRRRTAPRDVPSTVAISAIFSPSQPTSASSSLSSLERRRNAWWAASPVWSVSEAAQVAASWRSLAARAERRSCARWWLARTRRAVPYSQSLA